MKITTTEIVALGIEGMTCGSCRHRVEHAMREVRGVLDVCVDLAGGTAFVRYEPSRTSPEVLAQAVRGAGYEPTAPGIGSEPRSRPCCCCVTAPGSFDERETG